MDVFKSNKALWTYKGWLGLSVNKNLNRILPMSQTYCHRCFKRINQVQYASESLGRELHLQGCSGCSVTSRCQRQQHTVNHLPAFLFIFLFWRTKHRARKAQTERRTRLPLASLGASASLCQCCPSHRGQESLRRQTASTQEQHAARQHFASTRAPYGHDCLLLCIFGQLQHKTKSAWAITLQPNILKPNTKFSSCWIYEFSIFIMLKQHE